METIQAEDEPLVRAWLGTTFICSVGSYGYCACGFQHGENSAGRSSTDPKGIEKAAQETASLAAFREYLHPALMEVAEIRVLACWSDDVG